MSDSTGYAQPDLLADTDWLAEHLDDPRVRVVDCDVQDAFNRCHVPGAVPIPTHHYLKESDGALHVMGPEKFASLMGRMGIGDETTVVGYDNRGGTYAARLWWALTYYGHDQVKVLNGGWKSWFLERRPLSNRATPVEPRRFTPGHRPGLLATADDVQRSIGNPDVQLLDVRADDEWTGENRRGTKRGGRIPGAAHLEWVHYLTRDDQQTWLPAEELRRRLVSVGVTPDKQVYTYCQAGIRAAHGAFTLTLLGYPRVANYDGSWGEWGNREDLPIERD